MIPQHADLRFTVLLLNPDSAGNPLEHFSAEEAGQTLQRPLSHTGGIPCRIINATK